MRSLSAAAAAGDNNTNPLFFTEGLCDFLETWFYP
jgi:hypothetical protein